MLIQILFWKPLLSAAALALLFAVASAVAANPDLLLVAPDNMVNFRPEQTGLVAMDFALAVPLFRPKARLIPPSANTIAAGETNWFDGACPTSHLRRRLTFPVTDTWPDGGLEFVACFQSDDLNPQFVSPAEDRLVVNLGDPIFDSEMDLNDAPESALGWPLHKRVAGRGYSGGLVCPEANAASPPCGMLNQQPPSGSSVGIKWPTIHNVFDRPAVVVVAGQQENLRLYQAGSDENSSYPLLEHGHSQRAKNLKLSIGIYNLFDLHNRRPDSGDPMEDALQQNGRGLRIKLVGKF